MNNPADSELQADRVHTHTRILSNAAQPRRTDVRSLLKRTKYASSRVKSEKLLKRKTNE